MEKIIKPQFELILPESHIITTSWTSSSKGPTEFHYKGYNFFSNLIQKHKNVKFLISEDESFQNGNIGIPYKNETVKNTLDDKFIDFNKHLKDENIIIGKPKKLEAKTLIFTDGCLPSKGEFICNKLIIILNNPETWWARNIKFFETEKIELWYDDTLDFPITSLIVNLNKYKPNVKIKLIPNFPDIVPNTNNYKLKRKDPNKKQTFTYMVWCPASYSDLHSRDLFAIDQRYRTDIIKEIKEIIDLNKPQTKDSKLLIVGWSPNYDVDELIYLNKHTDQKINEDRRRATIYAEDLSEYFNCEVEIYPECDLPYENLNLEYDGLIYTPSIKNWEVSSRLIYECLYYKKYLFLPKTMLDILPNNPGLRRQLDNINKPK